MNENGRAAPTDLSQQRFACLSTRLVVGVVVSTITSHRKYVVAVRMVQHLHCLRCSYLPRHVAAHTPSKRILSGDFVGPHIALK
jgi:hypothetical protein